MAPVLTNTFHQMQFLPLFIGRLLNIGESLELQIGERVYISLRLVRKSLSQQHKFIIESTINFRLFVENTFPRRHFFQADAQLFSF